MRGAGPEGRGFDEGWRASEFTPQQSFESIVMSSRAFGRRRESRARLLGDSRVMISNARRAQPYDADLGLARIYI